MLTLVSIDASTPASNILVSSSFSLNNFAAANATADEIALELFSPYPVGISEFNNSLNFVFESCFFETIFSIVVVIRRELAFLLSDSKDIPEPSDDSIVTSTFGLIPIVAPFPVAIAFTIEMAP